jgi:hypothetical protein
MKQVFPGAEIGLGGKEEAEGRGQKAGGIASKASGNDVRRGQW